MALAHQPHKGLHNSRACTSSAGRSACCSIRCGSSSSCHSRRSGRFLTPQQSLLAPTRTLHGATAAATAAAAAAGRWHSSRIAAASFGKTQGFVPEDQFQPRLLTHHLQQAQEVKQLQQLWQHNRSNFNPIHFSALMQQLAVLHYRAKAGQAAAQQTDYDAGGSGPAAGSAFDGAGDTGSAEQLLPAELLDLLFDDNSSSSSSSSSSTGQQKQQQLQQQNAVGGPVQAPASQQQQAARGLQAGGSGRGTQQPNAAQSQQQLVRPAQPSILQQQQSSKTQQQQQQSPKQKQPTKQQRPPQLKPKQWERQKRQQQQQYSAQQLAHTVAAAALQPGTCEQLDGRALVMISHSLAKVGLRDPQLLTRIVQAASPQLLDRLDAQQLTNLVWSMAVCTAAVRAGTPSSSSSSGSVGRSSSSSSSSSSTSSPTMLGFSSRFEPPHTWLEAVAGAMLPQLPRCNSTGLAMAVWGFGQLGFRPNPRWWSSFWADTDSKLAECSGHELALLIHACGKLEVKPPESWLASYLAASCEVLTSLTPQQLTMSLWGMAASGCQPHKAWLMVWFLSSRNSMARAGTQELSMWMYSLALMRLTPSPVWCTSYVEATFERLTAANVRPQELVNVMWAISCMTWSPPLLYWRGLMEAARANFARFNPQDLANCISAATAVDATSLEKRWVVAFLHASEAKLPSFMPVQLAHTIYALGVLVRTNDWAALCISADWQAAFVQAAAQQLVLGRFSGRNLEFVVKGVQQLHFTPLSADTADFLRQADAALERLTKEQRQRRPGQQEQQQQEEQQERYPGEQLEQYSDLKGALKQQA